MIVHEEMINAGIVADNKFWGYDKARRITEIYKSMVAAHNDLILKENPDENFPMNHSKR